MRAPPYDPRADIRYRDREEAGAVLALALDRCRAERPVVLGIPRGGVPLAATVARALGGDLDVVVARKLGAPGHAELAIGAVTADGGRFLNQDVLAALHVSDEYLARVTAEQMEEARRRERRFRRGRAPVALEGRTVILVDDGLATGATMRAAVRSVRARGPARLVVAVPVGAPETCRLLAAEVDQVVCPSRPEPFIAIGLYYENFGQVDDEVVMGLLDRGAA